MKKLTIILAMLFIIIALSADDLEWRTILHGIGGFGVYSGVYVGTSALLTNIYWNTNSPEFLQRLETISFYSTFTGLIVYEYWSNDWEGFKFWDLTGSMFGMVAAKELWKGSRPAVYPDLKYHGKEKQIGLQFAVNF